MSTTELWRDLQGYLKLDFDINVNRVSESNSSSYANVVAKITVTNAAPAEAQDHPSVVFEDVTVHMGAPPDWEPVNLGVIRPGEAKVDEREFPLSVLPGLKYELTGSVSSEAFFRQRRHGLFPGSSAALSIGSYSQLFNEIDVHQWLNNTLRGFPLPEADSTLAEIKSLSESLEPPGDEVRETQERLKRIATFVDGRQRASREAVTEHQNLVQPYLSEVARAISQLRQALRNPNIQELGAQLEQTLESLSQQANRLDEATEKLLE